MLVTSTQRRGGEVFGRQIGDGLAERGWRVRFRSLVSSEGPSIEASPLVDKPRHALRTLDLGVIRALREEIASHRPDVVYANGGATLPAAVGAAPLRRSCRLVYGSIGEPSFWARSELARRRTGFLLRRCDLVTAVSHATRRQLVEDFGVPAERVVVAHPGVDAGFAEVASHHAEGPLRVLYLGSLSPEKGPDVALEAVQAASRSASIELRVVGGGPLMSVLRDTVAGASMESFVDITGPVDDVRPHLAWAEVLILPSASEGLPGVVLEAGAAGVPAVAHDVGGVSDVVVDGSTGVLVPRGDTEGLASALRRLAGDRELVSQLSTAIRAKVLAEFDLKAALDRYDDILRALVAGRPLESRER